MNEVSMVSAKVEILIHNIAHAPSGRSNERRGTAAPRKRETIRDS